MLKLARCVLVLCAALLGAASAAAAGDAEAPDKSAFNLFHPTDPERMRELSTDRPDKTESPYTVDAGHFQIESDLWNYSRETETTGGSRVKVAGFTAGGVNAKVGLTNDIDLQLVFETYDRVQTRDHSAGTSELQIGFGDIVTRLKVNFWGNDGGRTAFALMPFIKFPTAGDHLGNDRVEGGLIAPLAVDLPGGFGMGLMSELDLNLDGSGHGHHFEWIQSVTVSHDLVGSLGGYLELFDLESTEGGSRSLGTLDAGLTYALGANAQLDLGINLGLSHAADDVNPFVGFSFRC